MTGRDFEKHRQRERIARQGSDNILDFGPPGGLSPPRQRPSKADQRAEARAAVAEITRPLACPCGHKASIPVTAKMTGKRFRCTKCGEVAE